MPTDPTPEGLGILNKPVHKPFPEPTPVDEAQDSESDKERDGTPASLVTPDMEEPAETNRPLLGN